MQSVVLITVIALIFIQTNSKHIFRLLNLKLTLPGASYISKAIEEVKQNPDPYVEGILFLVAVAVGVIFLMAGVLLS
ncbi:hypothetical protein [Adhaeribacter pallidiroseus]|uniref:hypothetical protein n=1 Tax=Adhaeribacter pallidiroseus TaxID=2072847 RepID=UPI000E1BD957|nr:hypothetical protein [Adhaeribacter pallidiroseus]